MTARIPEPKGIRLIFVAAGLLIRRRRMKLAAAALAGLTAAPALASNYPAYTWSATQTNLPSGGSGTWDTTTADWWNGTTYVSWPTAPSAAVFQGTPGTVGLSADISVSELDFNVSGYTLAGNGHVLNNLFTIQVAPNVTANISASLGTSNIYVQGGGTLDLSGGDGAGGDTFVAGTTNLTGGYYTVNAFTAAPLQVGGSPSTPGTAVAKLNITGGARFQVLGNMGQNPTGTSINGVAGTTLTIDGAGSTFSAGDQVYVGDNASGSLVVQNGGAITSDLSTTVYVGLADGYSGKGSGSMLVQSGGTVKSWAGVIGRDANSTGSVTVTGPGSAWTSSSYISVVNGTMTVSNAGTVTGSTYIPAGGSVIVNGGMFNAQSLSGSGPITITDPVGGHALQVGGNSTQQGTYYAGLSYTGTISGTGSVLMNGPQQVFSGVNTYSGGTSIEGGTLIVNPGGTLGSGAINLSGGILVIGADSAIPSAGINFSGGTLALQNYVSSLQFNNAGNMVLASYNGPAGLAPGSLTGSTALTVNIPSYPPNPGPLTLNGTNTYTGGTTFQAGVVAISSDAALGTGPLNFTGGVLQLNGYTSQLAFPNANKLTITVPAAETSTLAGMISGTTSLTFLGPGTLQLTGNNTFSGGLLISGGTLIAGSSGALPSGTSIHDNAVLEVNADSTVGDITGFGSMSVSNATLNARSLTLNALIVGPAGVLKLQPSQTAVNQTSSLSLAPSGTLDLTDRSFQIIYVGANSPLAQVRQWIETAYDVGKWDGYGITSSLADANHFVAYSGGASTANSTNTLQLQLGIPGDTNLDGKVNLTDLLTLVRDFGHTNATWSMGDFDYDGMIDLNDMLLLARHFGGTLTPAVLAGFAPAQQAQIESTFAQVPEPAALGLLCGATLLLRRRKDARWSN